MSYSTYKGSSSITASQIYMAARGDQESIAQLYERSYDAVYRTVKAMVQDEDLTLDILQDSYVKAFQSLDQLDRPQNFCPWMKRIAVNKAKDYFKRRKPVLFSELPGEDGQVPELPDDRLDTMPEEVLDRQETSRLISQILSGLSDQQRMAITMYYYDDMSIQEIASVLECSVNTVKSRLSYGRKKVEAQVLALEKQGVKLYSLAPVPFLLWLLRMDADAVAPSVGVLKTVLQQSVLNPTIGIQPSQYTQPAPDANPYQVPEFSQPELYQMPEYDASNPYMPKPEDYEQAQPEVSEAYPSQEAPAEAYEPQPEACEAYPSQEAQPVSYEPQPEDYGAYSSQDAQPVSYEPQPEDYGTYSPQEPQPVSYEPQPEDYEAYSSQEAQPVSYEPQPEDYGAYSPQEAQPVSYEPQPEDYEAFSSRNVQPAAEQPSPPKKQKKAKAPKPPKAQKAARAAAAGAKTSGTVLALKITAGVLSVALLGIGGFVGVKMVKDRQKPEPAPPTEATLAPAAPTQEETQPAPSTEPDQMVITPTGIADAEEYGLTESAEATEEIPFLTQPEPQPRESEASEPEQTEQSDAQAEVAPPAKSDTPEGQLKEMLAYYRRLMALDAQSVLDGKYQNLDHIDTLYRYFKSQIKTGVTQEEAVFAEDADFWADVVYCTPDLDRDGKKELVIATVTDYGDGKSQPEVEQVFCFDGSGRMASIFPESGYLLQDGTLWCLSGNSGIIEYVLRIEASQPKAKPAEESEMGKPFSPEAVEAHGGYFTSEDWKSLSE